MTKQFTITIDVDPDTMSADGKHYNFEGFLCLLDNLVRDGLAHAEPALQITRVVTSVPGDGGAKTVTSYPDLH